MLFQNKENKVINVTDLKESIENAEKQGLIKLVDKQLEAYNNKPEFGIWNGNEWIVDTIQCEEQRISSIKSKAGELINSKYPDYKQLNIIRIGGADLGAMTAYIDGIRAISNEAERNGTKVEDVQWQS